MAAASLLLVGAAAASAADTASYAIDTQVKLVTDQRTRGISDSYDKPGVKLSMLAVHESGLVALAELATVSKTQFLKGKGVDLTLAGGYRFGDPEAWHYGVGAATEVFADARFDAPFSFDAEGNPTDFRSTNYNTTFAVLEVGYGAVEGRILNVLSKTYRGANTGGVCGTMLQYTAATDPTQALACYGRGDHNSRGSWLFDLGYKLNLDPATTLNLHAGYQKVANFKEANFSDYSVGVTHKHWGFEWNAEWLTTNTRVPALYLQGDASAPRATDNSKLVLAVSHGF
jgi:hypothetical protein